MAPRFSGALQPLFPLLFQPLRRTLAILFGPLLLRAGRVRVEGPSKHRCSAEAPYQRRVRAHSFLSIGVIRAIRGCRCRMPQASFRCLPGSFDFSIPPTDSRLSRAGVTLIAPSNPRSFHSCGERTIGRPPSMPTSSLGFPPSGSHPGKSVLCPRFALPLG